MPEQDDDVDDRFDWDPDTDPKGNTRHIWNKWKISKQAAEQAASDPMVCDAPVYSTEAEFRDGVLGITQDYTVLIVVYTERGDRVRVIHAKRATRRLIDRYWQERGGPQGW